MYARAAAIFLLSSSLSAEPPLCFREYSGMASQYARLAASYSDGLQRVVEGEFREAHDAFRMVNKTAHELLVENKDLTRELRCTPPLYDSDAQEAFYSQTASLEENIWKYLIRSSLSIKILRTQKDEDILAAFQLYGYALPSPNKSDAQ